MDFKAYPTCAATHLSLDALLALAEGSEFLFVEGNSTDDTAAVIQAVIAENPDFAPIVVDLKRDPFAIEGIAVGVIRPSI